MRAPIIGMALICVALAGCSDGAHETKAVTVYRICRDGSYIWHYSDGTFRTSFGYRVDDPDKACQS
jgi:hypothetical protein